MTVYTYHTFDPLDDVPQKADETIPEHMYGIAFGVPSPWLTRRTMIVLDDESGEK